MKKVNFTEMKSGTKEEYLSLFQAAGLQAPVLRRRWPERVSIVWKR